MRVALVLVSILLAGSVAGADDVEPNAERATVVPRTDGVSIAVGVNLPFGWRSKRQSLAGSLQVGLARHHAIRGTLARHPYMRNIASSLIELAGNVEAEGPRMTGQITEVGVGWQYFPGSFNRGPLVEAGLFRRHIDGAEDYRFNAPEYLATDTVGYGMRGLIGWSWRFWGDHVFFATAFGLGMARHTGTETTSIMTDPRDDRAESVTRYVPSAEFYVRVGGAIDLF
jgi:hypothetical protein